MCMSRPSVIFFVFLLLTLPLQSANGQTTNSFFGMQMNHEIILGEPWPVDSFGALRLWDAGVSWSSINPTPGQYDWSTFDVWLKLAQQRNVDVLYVFGHTPRWASANPNEPGCGNTPGECEPPNDLNSDGSGTNQHFKDFVTAIVRRSASRIHYWEIWDEAPNPARWKGTIAQIVRLSSDANAIIKAADPSAIILSPSSGMRYTGDTDFMNGFLSAGGGNYVDIFAIHGYVQQQGLQPVPENFITYVNEFKAIFAMYNQDTKPIWDTEGSWGIATCCKSTDSDLQAGFVARYVLMHATTQVQRLYWYEWNNNVAGTLWLPNYSTITSAGTLLNPGIAYQQVYNWMVGATLTQPCAIQGTVWTCDFSRPGGYVAKAVWDTSQTCSSGTCTSSQYNVPPGFVNYYTVYGQTVAINGPTVSIGYQPILLVNQ